MRRATDGLENKPLWQEPVTLIIQAFAAAGQARFFPAAIATFAGS